VSTLVTFVKLGIVASDASECQSLAGNSATTTLASSRRKISASGKISHFQEPLLAGQFAGDNGPIAAPLPAGTITVQLGSFMDENSDAELVGSAQVKSVTKNNQMFDLESVKIKAVPPQ